MMKKTILSFLMMLTVVGVFAQEVEFTADRPGASTGPAIVGKGVIQWEQGMQYDGDGAKGSFTYSNTLLRYGLFDGVEVRLGCDAFSYDYFGSWKSAFSGLGIGAKIRCCDKQGAIPAIAVLTDLQIPGTGAKGFAAEYLTPSPISCLRIH